MWHTVWHTDCSVLIFERFNAIKLGVEYFHKIFIHFSLLLKILSQIRVKNCTIFRSKIFKQYRIFQLALSLLEIEYIL